MRLEGRTALVTGGALRVGRAIASSLGRRGANVGITYLTSEPEAGETVAELCRIGVRAHAIRCDQRDPASVAAAVREIEVALGPVDVLVNSAAIFRHTPFPEATVEDWDEHLEVNLRGPWLFCQAVGPAMRLRGTGAIVNMIDIAAERPYPGYLPYCISKAGLAAMTRGLAVALAPEVRVNGIAPGEVLWPDGFPEDQKAALLEKIPLRRIGSPEEVAAAVLYLTESSDFATGVILPLDGGRSVAG
jgi:pteridine reductase